MPKKQLQDPIERVENLLLRLLVVQLHQGGATVKEIAKNLGIGDKTVTSLLNGLNLKKK